MVRSQKTWIRQLFELFNDIYARHSISVVDSLEARTHEGHGFYSEYTFDITGGSTEYILGKVEVDPDGERVHMKDRKIVARDISTSSIDVSVDLYLDPTVDVEGTPVTKFNADHSIEANGLFCIFHTPTTTDDGTNMGKGARIVADKKTADNVVTIVEYLMNPGSYYLLKVHNNGSGGTVNMTLSWNWYVD